ncbi:MAG: CDP-glycerol glycerophosphotransferase family protein [Methanothermobacter sp.]|nr:CDP-glycerol glycerophosphotransferase family protein [Methanothermobacter sp.]MDI9617645.1 CDP-glycerol glycerophosphotransferase family protein [Methanothermobacter sp.]
MIPKDKKMIVFDSAPDFSGNSMALFDFIKEIEDKECVWIVDEPADVPDVKQEKRHSLRALFRILRAGTIVSTHGRMAEIRVSRQRYVNLWHGMPLKAMAYTETNGREFKPPVSFDDENYYLIATSTIMKNALAACFNQDARRIHITGQPRNDKLFRPGRLSEILSVNPDSYRTIILFAPTFRSSEFIDDGNLISHHLNFHDFDADKFSRFLQENDILFLVKFHPLEEDEARKFFKRMDNVLLIESDELTRRHADLYDILGGVDVLVTDYSSVYFDFLLLDRPIVFAVPDLEEYRRRRGFVLEPFEFWTPGPKVRTFSEFLAELEKCINDEDYYRDERRMINELVNQYQDDRSSERVYKLVWGED